MKLKQQDEDIICLIDCPDYIRHVQMSKSRKEVYYVKGKKEPKAAKYQSQRYGWKKEVVKKQGKQIIEYHLWDLATNEKIIANSRTAGTPKIKVINGQELYNSRLREHEKGRVMDEIEKYFNIYLKDIKPIPLEMFPIKIYCILYDHFNDPITKYQDWDVFNRFLLYGKKFEDCLTRLGIIPDDNRKYITQPPAVIYTPLKETQQRKMRFIITKDKRKIIQLSGFYNYGK